MPDTSPYGIHWFRRDLRVAGNPALQWNWKQHQGRVLGLFAFDKTFLARPDFSHNRFGFFLKTLQELQKELREIGSDLLVLDTGPQPAFETVFAALHDQGLPRPQVVTFNRDYEPFARNRDQILSTWLPDVYGVNVHTERDHLVFEPEEITRNNEPGALYQVYTPFSKRWFERFATDDGTERIAAQAAGLRYLSQRSRGQVDKNLFSLTWQDLFSPATPPSDHLTEYLGENRQHVTIPLPEAGSLQALARLRDFHKSGLTEYSDRRDFPTIDGTSQLSIYLKNGSLTTPMILAAADLEHVRLSEKNGPTQFVKELVWREFYYHVLYHRPEVEHTAFLEQYRNLQWENREDWFEAWKDGRTGYPIVDAGMRQLKTTGWMHNRVRMIVASFLTKDLLIDWRWGERWFMEQLLDGDLAPNNGGWQWAASTGCDPQPYFRIFNPTLQSQKFDPEGDYIRRYVPELKDVPAKAIHAPHEHRFRGDYPKPIVDHAVQREKALQLYKVAR